MHAQRRVRREALADAVGPDFYRPAHQSLIVAIRALAPKGRARDKITMFDFLESRGLKMGRSEVMSICDNIYAFVEAQSHLEIVRRSSL